MMPKIPKHELRAEKVINTRRFGPFLLFIANQLGTVTIS